MSIQYTLEKDWYGYHLVEFEFQERRVVLVSPKEACEGKKWLLKTEYFGAFPEFELEMLSRGYHVAYLKNVTRWHHPSDDDAKDAFCEFMHQEFGFHPQCVPVGMSCGGMQAVYFAAKYPNRVAGLYLDAPVMNLLSCPCGMGIATDELYDDFYEHTGVTRSELLNYRNHPIDHKEELLKGNVPIILVAGDSDGVVPYCENGQLLYDYYKANGGDITLILKEGCDHHPHGLDDHTPLIEFVNKYYK